MAPGWNRATTAMVALLAVSCAASDTSHPTGDAASRDGSTSHSDASQTGLDGSSMTCVDINMDGIADFLEHNVTAGVIGDEDQDGFSDLIEGNGSYQDYDTSTGPLACHTPKDCDGDGIYNFRDTDSDNDGLTDAEEFAHHTNPCAADTDGDQIDDLTEVAANSSPTDSSSTPPSGSLYVTLPYHPPTETGAHEHRPLTFATRIQLADVFILVDNSASMQPIIANLQANLSSTIVPGIHRAIPNARIGLGSFDSVPDGLDGDPGAPGDYSLWIRQPLADDTTLAQAAVNAMHTIDQDRVGSYDNRCRGPYCGGDVPENQVEALFEVIQGDGMAGHQNDENARLSVHDARDPHGDGYIPQMDPVRDCAAGPDSPTTFGWGCFQQGRVPILVLCSDAGWYNGFASTSDSANTIPNDTSQHTAGQLLAAMNAHGAFYVGIDVGTTLTVPGYPPFPPSEGTFLNSTPLAQMTNTVDAMNRPIVFSTMGNIDNASSQIVDAIREIAESTPQDITTDKHPDATETRLSAPHVTTDFIKGVAADHGDPEAPTGYDHHDATTFYTVAPSTSVTFDVDFYNDFQPQGSTATLFRATILVIGRAGSTVDSRDVYIIVPAAGAQPPG